MTTGSNAHQLGQLVAYAHSLEVSVENLTACSDLDAALMAQQQLARVKAEIRRIRDRIQNVETR